MKLSDLKNKNIIKKMKIVNGEAIIENLENTPQDEVEFYELNSQKLMAIYSKLEKEDIEISDEDFAYLILGEICNIEIDVTLDEFRSMMDNPSKVLVKFMKTIIEIIKDAIDMANDVADMSGDINEIQDISSLEVTEKSKEEQIDELWDEMFDTQDNDTRKEIFNKIKSLQDEE